MRTQKFTTTDSNLRKSNKYMCDYQVVSRRQIEFGIFIRNYRRAYNLSQAEFAKLCSIYGNKRITSASISNWENFTDVPTVKNMNIVLDTMHIELKDLD